MASKKKEIIEEPKPETALPKIESDYKPEQQQGLTVALTAQVKYVYLAGSMRNETNGIAGWRPYTSDFLAKNNIWALNPERAKDPKLTSAEAREFYTPAEIVARDVSDIKRSSIMIAELNDPNYTYVGTLMEMAYAMANNVPVVVWSNNEYMRTHLWVRHHCVRMFTDLDELLSYIKFFLTDS